jgi:hypothetical protein
MQLRRMLAGSAKYSLMGVPILCIKVEMLLK